MRRWQRGLRVHVGLGNGLLYSRCIILIRARSGP